MDYSNNLIGVDNYILWSETDIKIIFTFEDDIEVFQGFTAKVLLKI